MVVLPFVPVTPTSFSFLDGSPLNSVATGPTALCGFYRDVSDSLLYLGRQFLAKHSCRTQFCGFGNIGVSVGLSSLYCNEKMSGRNASGVDVYSRYFNLGTAFNAQGLYCFEQLRSLT